MDKKDEENDSSPEKEKEFNKYIIAAHEKNEKKEKKSK